MDDAALATRLALLEAHVDWLYLNSGYTPPYGHSGTPPVTATSSEGGGGYSAAVLDQVRNGNKIGAIKQYREETGVGLKEAKDAIDRLG
jgi:large subunit ribosomal protein L7/L12